MLADELEARLKPKDWPWSSRHSISAWSGAESAKPEPS